MQSETEGNGFVPSISQNENCDRNALEVHISQTLPAQEGLSQLSNEGALHQLSGEPLQLVGRESLNDMAGQGQLHQMSNMAQIHPSLSMQAAQVSDSDIAAPEVRTRLRSQVEEVVVLQSTFTQTLPLTEESKKACQSVAVQTHCNPDYEPQAYSVITGDGGVSYDSDGVRVLRAIGTWTPNYQSGTQQFVDQNSDVYMNGSGTTSSPENSMMQNSVSNSPNTSVNCMPTTQAANDMSVEHSQDHSSANKQSPGDKQAAFVCPVCNKGLARKDKLVIHMRIHTGEKPYVCEVCERAFARRDKLVMHMNKLKHVTPSNFAPLGKRQNQSPLSAIPMLPEKRQDLKLETQEMGSPASSVDIQPATLVQVVHEQPTMTWNCELCGRICLSREEWTVHARSHLDGDSNFATSSVSSGLSVLTPLSSYQFSGTTPDRQTCVVCRQEFPSKTDLILHLRTHFVGKPELLANHVAGLADSSGVCS